MITLKKLLDISPRLVNLQTNKKPNKKMKEEELCMAVVWLVVLLAISIAFNIVLLNHRSFDDAKLLDSGLIEYNQSTGKLQIIKKTP